MTWRTNRTLSDKDPIVYLQERADNCSLGKVELKRRLRTHLIPHSRLAVGYNGMSDDERRGRVKSDYDAFLSARAEVLALAAHLACEGKPLELGELLDDAN